MNKDRRHSAIPRNLRQPPTSHPQNSGAWSWPGWSPALAGCVLGLSLAVVSASLSASERAEAQGARGVQQGAPVTPAIADVDLRSLPTLEAGRAGDPVREVPRRDTSDPGRPDPGQGAGRGAEPSSGGFDPLLLRQNEVSSGIVNRDFSIPDINIEGITYTNAVPPDPAGDVGPGHYIQMTNDGFGGSAVAVYDKSGTLLAGPFGLDTLWTAGGPCGNGRGDPIPLYDPLADRWLLTEFAGSGNHLCVYVSRTPDPLAGGWFLYDFAVPQFPDYPKYGVWPDAYYVSSNESNPAAYALDRIRMLNGQSATFQRFAAPRLGGFPFEALIPSDLDGPTPPPAGSPNYFMRHRDDEAHSPLSADPGADFLEIWEYHADFANPTLSTFGLATTIPVTEFDSNLCGLSSFFCFPQPGTSTTLDPLREVVMWRLQYRNLGTHEALIGNLVTDVDGTDHGGIRWFELRKSGVGVWSLFQEGTYSPDADHRWMGSIAADKDGNIALGYSISSTSLFPSIRYAGRLAGDPLGTLPQGEHSIIEGSFSQTSSTRWGDYSAMTVDPLDDCSFWYTMSYVGNSASQWSTRIARLRFASCTGDPSVGAAMRGLFLGAAACINNSTGQSVFLSPMPGQYAWDCETAGLPVSAGDVVFAVGVGMVPSSPQTVGGSVKGGTPVGALCRNITQSQDLFITIPPGDTEWDCESAGLPVNAGDLVQQVGVMQAN